MLNRPRSVDIPQVVRHFFSAAEQAIFADLPRKHAHDMVLAANGF